MDAKQAVKTADEIIEVYRQNGGSNYAGEEITQLEHACQAALLAEKQGFDDEVILAAFLHDLGHLLEDEGVEMMEGYGVKDHEAVGATYLRERGFSEKIATLIEAHVAAKRYLCYANERYYDNLSDASKMTLAFQGGPMNAEEAMAFEINPLKNLIIRMRTWDEEAKMKGVPNPDLEIYRKKMIAHLAGSASGSR